MKNTQVLTVVQEGDILPRHGGEVVVGPKCDTNRGHWHCATHYKDFANQLQKDIHIHSGRHQLAWVCQEHGVEVP
jgi:hypothetical protein